MSNNPIADAIDAGTKEYSPAGAIKLVSANELKGMTFPPIKWIVPGIVPEGLTLLAGKPKIGKSWAVLDLLFAVSSESLAFQSRQCEQGQALYLALEDNPRRMQGRLNIMHGLQEWPDSLQLAFSAPKLGEGLEGWLEQWIEGQPNPRLVVIDTLKFIRQSAKATESAYDSDYESLIKLQRMAADKGIGIILVHHTRKMDAEDPFDTVSGTTGLTGCADTTIVLHRGGMGTTLYGRGRDVEEFELAVEFVKNKCRWKLLGEAGEVQLSDERKQIVDILFECPDGLSPTEVADLIGGNSTNIRRMLTRMHKDQEIIKVKRGHYQHVSHFESHKQKKKDKKTGKGGHNGHKVTSSEIAFEKHTLKEKQNVTDVKNDGHNRARVVTLVSESDNVTDVTGVLNE